LDPDLRRRWRQRRHVGSQTIFLSNFSRGWRSGEPAHQRSEQCQASMIELHGQEAWDTAVAERAAIQAAAVAAEEAHVAPT
jgi:hypothetical protein